MFKESTLAGESCKLFFESDLEIDFEVDVHGLDFNWRVFHVVLFPLT